MNFLKQFFNVDTVNDCAVHDFLTVEFCNNGIING